MGSGTPARGVRAPRDCRSAPRGSATACAAPRSSSSGSRPRASAPSCVARVALRGRPVLAMAADAEAHLQVLGLLDHVHVLYFPVALLAWEPPRDVPLVAEVDVIGLTMHADPRHGLPGLVVL